MALFKRSHVDEDDSVSLADDDHAWWASRDHLERAFVPKHRGDSEHGETSGRSDTGSKSTGSTFSDRYSTESLFNWASSSEPDDPTFGGRGMPLDPYRILGLQPGASLSEVVAAHRSLAKRYHPDQFFSAEESERHAAAQKMSTVNAAYQELRSRLMAHRHAH